MNQHFCLPPEVFDRWAPSYDAQPNPLLALEQRVLLPMLGGVCGLDILDAGCGTGRWLRQLAGRSARSLVGVDISPVMLELAAGKLNHGCELVLGSCTALPVRDATADLVLSSFVVSYLDDVDGFAQEIDRVARPGAMIFLTDMHPETEASLQWKRGWRSGTQVDGRGWTLSRIIQAFETLGFTQVSLTEPAFGIPEQQIFMECGREDLYESAAGLPAIYVLQLRKPPVSRRPRPATQDAGGSTHLTGGRCARGPDSAEPASLSIVGGMIHQAQSGGRASERFRSLGEISIDLSGFLILPGLINAHDHLEFSLFPNIGDGPYANAKRWAHDIHANHASLIALHREVPRPVRLWWGAIRNLLSGVTTVCHHNPITQELVGPGFPVRVVTGFDWAHSLSLEPDLAEKFARSREDAPFILHAAEGIDEESAEEVFALDREHALDQRTVLVHGLGCTEEGVALINQRQAAVILCPTSNKFLFHRSPLPAFIGSLNKVTLGSDSPLTAAGDLLDEIHFARTHIGLDAGQIYDMVTNRAADILRLRRGEGQLKPGSVADLLVVRDCGLSPAEMLAQLNMAQVELVMLAGRVELVGPRLFARLPSELKRGLQLFEVDGQRRWVRAPMEKLIAEAEVILGSEFSVGGKRVRRVPAA
jgi:cytosine/adenosine deaminase-related metal-dependent hydrolase/ubiquinone/menaquinone biosynthesis C-methylase UbiE